MLNHEAFIDDNNCYAEAFDMPDCVQWEIAFDISERLLEMLDEEKRRRIRISVESVIPYTK